MADWASWMKWVFPFPPKGIGSSGIMPTKDAVQFLLVPSSNIIRFAGISGALAVSFSAYGAHALEFNKINDKRRIRAFEVGSRYHIIHSVAILSSPFARYPLLTASLFTAGIIFFCGNCYYYSFTGNEIARKYVPIGGTLFIIAWLSLIA